MIKIKSFGSDETIETHEFTGSIGSFLDQFCSEWRKEVIQPIIISINDIDVLSIDWDSTLIKSNDNVEILVLPRGGVFKAIGSIISTIFSFFMPKQARQAQRQQTPQGSKIENSEIKSNNASIGSVVPELFGRYRVFPSYLTEPRRYFVNKRQQEVSTLLCVGVGSYNIEQIKAGETLLDDLVDTSYRQFNPNQNVGSYAEAWHTVAEVGATSSGTAGLELSADRLSRDQLYNEPSLDGYRFSGTGGRTITRLDNNIFNENYSNQVVLNISRKYSYLARSRNDTSTDGFTILELVGVVSHISDSDNVQTIDGFSAIVFTRNNDGTGIIRFYNPTPIGNQSKYLIYSNQGIYERNQSYEREFITKWQINSLSGNLITLRDKTDCFFITGDDATAKISYFSGGENRPIYTNRFSATPSGVKTNQIELDIFFANGLCWINDDGGLSSNSVNIQVEVVDKALNQVVFSAYRTYTEATNDQIGFTERIDLPYSFEPLVRMRRLERGSDSVQSHSTVTWYGLKSRLPNVPTYEKWTTLGVTMRSGGKISAQSESSINMIATRLLPELNQNGTWSSAKPTRQISSFTRYIAEQIGYTLNDIDIAELQRLNNQYWIPRGETFDFVFDETTVKDAIELAFNAGMSGLTIANGKIKPVRNEKRTVLEQSYSAQNIVGELSQSFRSRRVDDYDGVEVEYADPETFDKKVVQCLLPDSQGFKIRKLSLQGVTDKNRAYIIGMREASQDRYINREFNFKTEMDGFNSQYMSYIAVIDDVPSFGQSTLILEVNGNEITLSDNIIGNPTVFAFRDRKGKLNGTYKVLSFNKNKAVIQFTDSVPVVSLNYELPHAYFGTSERWAHKCLVTDISPNGIDSATIKATNYDDRVYAYDNTEKFK